MEMSKQDFKIFKDKIADWQKTYIEKLNKEYINILNSTGNPSEKFWTLEKRIKNDKKSCGVSIELNKNNFPYDIVMLIKDGVITVDEIKIFSEELQEKVLFMLNL